MKKYFAVFAFCLLLVQGCPTSSSSSSANCPAYGTTSVDRENNRI